MLTKPHRTFVSCIVAVVAIGCGAADLPVAERARDRPLGDPLPSRTLPEAATFRDLVVAARALHDRAAGDSDAACLLAPREGRHRLAADLAVAVRPLPDPPADLDERLQGVERVAALTRWGTRGAEGTLVLGTFTNHPPPAPAGTALILTDRGVYLRPVGQGRSETAGVHTVADAARAVPRGSTRYIAAEADVTVATLAALLGELSTVDAVAQPSVVVLATVLAPNTRLPPVDSAAQNAEGLCPEGLSPSNATPAGSYEDPSSVMAALTPMRDAAAACVAQGRSPGGRLAIAFRVAADGSVTDACAEVDQTEDPQLRACVLNALSSVRFPPPDVTGAVDLRLPLDLVAEANAPQAPLCRL